MAATLAGEAAIRIVPSLRGFKPEADRRLKQMTFDPVNVKIEADTAEATVEIKAWKKRQELDAVNVPVRADFQAFRRDLTQVEHIFKKSAIQRAIKLNIKVIGLDALPALALAAGSAATGVDALAKSLFALPGIAGGALASIGALAVGMRGIGDAFKAYAADQKNAAQNAKDVESANKSLQRSYRDYKGAVRDTIREIQDLNAENRRSSLNVADAVLSVQEAAQTLRKGGQKTILEFKRDQLSYLQAVDHLQDVQTRAKRTAEDTADANAKGVGGADQVVDALDRIAAATEEANSKGMSEYATELAKLAPEAQKAMNAITAFDGRWKQLTGSVQGKLWDGLDGTITNLGQKALPGLEIGLSRVASGLNKNFKTIGESLGSDSSQGFLERIFGNTEGGLQNLARGMNPLIEGVLRLTKESSDFLPRLGAAADKVFTKFDDWTKRISGDGSLDKWINQGLNALTDLGNAASSILSIFNSISDAYIKSGGNDTGFIGTLSEKTKQLADFLAGRGQTSLVHYFTQAREFVSDLTSAIDKMVPFIKEATDTAREWSSVFFDVAGAALQAANFIDRNTHLLKTLLLTYLTLKTVAPIWNGMTTAAKNYNTVVQAAARNSTFQKSIPGLLAHANALNDISHKSRIVADVQKDLDTATSKATSSVSLFTEAQRKQIAGMDKASERATKMNANITNFVSPARTASDGARTLGSNADRLATQLDGVVTTSPRAAEGLKKVGDEADTTSGKIGSSGGIGLLGRIGTLGAALGPQAALLIAIPLALAGLNKLGEANREGADAAQEHADKLKNLAETLDTIQGTSTRATIAQVGKDFQSVQVPNVFNDGANANDAFKRLQIDPGQAQVAAASPTQKPLLDELLKKTDAKLLGQLDALDPFKGLAPDLKQEGVDNLVLALALTGDAEAVKKYTAAEKKIEQVAEMAGAPVNVPDLASVWNDLPDKDAALAGYSLRTTSATNYAAGAGTLAATQNTTGKQKLTINGANTFGIYGPGADPVIDPNTLDGRIILNQRPPDGVIKDWTENKGWTFPEVPNGDGTYTVVIPASENPGQFLEKLPAFSQGGLIRGPGTGTSDSILARVSDREHVANAAAVKYYGADLFDALNRKALPRFSTGGFGGFNMPLAPPSVPWQPAIPPLPVPAPVTAPGRPMPVTPAPTPVSPPTGSTGAGIDTLPGPLEISTGIDARPGPISISDPIPANPHLPSVGAAPGPRSAGMPFAGESYGLEPGTNIEYGEAGFPAWVYELGNRFGVEPSTYAEHQEDSGLNRGIDWRPRGLSWDSPEGAAVMERFATYLRSAPGPEQVIFENALTGTRVGRDPGDRGANQTIDDYYAASWGGHRNHVHTRFSSSIPLPEQLGMILQGGSPMDLLSQLPGGFNQANLSPWDAMQAKWSDMFNMEKRYANAYQPENVFNFLAGQANSVGSQLLNIGTEFLSGATGINFGAILGPGQQVANGFLGGSDSDSASDGSEDTDTVDSLMTDYVGGGGISADSQEMLKKYGWSGDLGSSGKKGAEAYRPLVRDILKQVAPQYGITNTKAWEDALVKQIDTESGGDPFSFNGSDSNGKGGTQQVEGLFNFLGTTFQAHNKTGGGINDPVAQVYAAIDYVSSKYGMNEDGSPKQIGRGVGFAAGGFPTKGLAMVSNGEYHTGSDATSYYGANLYNALNAKAIPREAIRGFAAGGFPLQLPQPLGAAGTSIAGITGASPQGQTPGPLPGLSSAVGAAGAGLSGSAPSTGGAPGPGATAPAPDPGALSAAQSAFQMAQPGGTGTQAGDPRATLGAAPTSNEHNNPALSAGIKGAWSHIGSIAATAASMAIGAGSMGAGAVGGAGAAGAGIQAGFQIGGQVASGLTNVLSSLLVGTATNGSTGNASGVPLLPQRQPQQTGVPAIAQGRVHNGDVNYHVSDLDGLKRQMATTAAQEAAPIQKYAI